jgi:6-pyruvoyltetrahydropterin/6-carboxytetrahydropterin synthase
VQQQAVILQRVVRFAVNPDSDPSGSNGFSSRPSMTGFGRYYEIELSCSGYPDPQTGYLIDIHEIDSLVRKHLVPIITNACTQNPMTHPALIMPELWDHASTNLSVQLRSLTFSLSPHTRLTMNTSTDKDCVLLRQRYEFSASHRLHCDTLDAEANRRIFGKCNNPNGHGHNYHVEPSISIPLKAVQEGCASSSKIDAIVDSSILDLLDHKHLNADCPAFDQSKGGMMPSVENIAKFCYQQLLTPASRLTEGAKLVNITVWETDRTSCTYPASAS